MVFKYLIFIIFFISGCAAQSFGEKKEIIPPVAFSALNLEDNLKALDEQLPEYRIGTGDELKIDVYKQPDLSSKSMSISQFAGQVVDELGEISFPLLKKVKASGLTRTEISRLIEEKLRSFVKEPDVTVEIVKYNSKFFYITGGSTSNGKYPISPTTNLLEAVSRISVAASGSSNDLIVNTIYMKRDETVIPITVSDISRSKRNYSKIYLKDGDIFFIPSSSAERAYVVGEVIRPGAYRITKPDFSVLDLIAEAGGINPISASESSIYLVRQYGGKYVYAQLDYGKVLGGDPNHNVILAPGDRLIVSPTALTSYNRIIEQILPTFQLMQAVMGTINGIKALK